MRRRKRCDLPLLAGLGGKRLHEIRLPEGAQRPHGRARPCEGTINTSMTVPSCIHPRTLQGPERCGWPEMLPGETSLDRPWWSYGSSNGPEVSADPGICRHPMLVPFSSARNRTRAARHSCPTVIKAPAAVKLRRAKRPAAAPRPAGVRAQELLNAEATLTEFVLPDGHPGLAWEVVIDTWEYWIRLNRSGRLTAWQLPVGPYRFEAKREQPSADWAHAPYLCGVSR